MAPARRQRSTLRLASTIASSEAAAHEGLHRDLGRDDADRIAALGDDRVDADRVLFPKGLALSSDRVHRDHRRVERVDAALRRPAGMRRPAEKADLLDHGAVRRFGDRRARLLPIMRAGVDHHRHVDIVEMALGDEFGLAEHEFDLALGDAAEPLLDIDEFLGRHREKDDLAGEVVGDLGVGQRHRRTQHPGDLRVVAAAVRRTGHRIGERMLRGAQAVEFADQGEPRSRRAARQTDP